GLLSVQTVAGKQQTLRPFRTNTKCPQRTCRHSPNSRRRISDRRIIRDDYQVRTECEVCTACHAEAMNLAYDRLVRMKETHKAPYVAAHHGVVDHRIPRLLWIVIS